MNSTRIIELLELQPLADEGGVFRQNHGDAYSSAIYFLVRPDDFSALHRLTGTEIYHFYAGDPLQMLLLHPGGRIERPVLGSDLEKGHRPQLAVTAGVWQGSFTTGEYSLLGATMAPGFQPEGFELARRSELLSTHPTAAADIVALTRESTSPDQ